MRPSLIKQTLLGITLTNFAAQIPYYLHQYYFPHHILPSPVGVTLMLGVLAWFLIGFYLLAHRKPFGFWLTVAFLFVEFVFYLLTQVTQWASGNGLFLYVLHPTDATLFIVFGIGYLNFFAAAGMLYVMLTHRHQYIAA